MKTSLVTVIILLITPFITYAQDGGEFDFWVGKWNLSWEYQDGSTGNGINNIISRLDGKVIQENFEATDSGPYKGFKGTSISVFNPNNKIWHQAWADNQGGFFNFVGEVSGNRRIFKTKPYKKDDKEIVLRMVFKDIQENSLTWDWEQTVDGGETWVLQWRIKYKRAI